MLRVDRNSVPVPKSLSGPESAAARERSKAKAYIQAAKETVEQGGKRPKAYGFSIYKDEACRLALEALFHGKCAYCETYYASQGPVDIEHYRPKGGVEDDPDHWGYWWLAADWKNLLPSCIDCNRRRYQVLPTPDTASLIDLRALGRPIWQTGKENAFPVKEGTRAFGLGDDPDTEVLTEKPYLLNPCDSDADPAQHLEFLVDSPVPFGLILPRRLDDAHPDAPTLSTTGANINPAEIPSHLSARGAVSIQVYGLNRLGLVQARTRVLRQLEALRIMIAEADTLARKLEKSRSTAARDAVPVLDGLIDRLVEEIRRMGEADQPFSAMVDQWTKRWLHHLTAPTPA